MSGRRDGDPDRDFRVTDYARDARADAEDEVQHYLEEREAELRAEGHSPEAARRIALERFGDPERVVREVEAVTEPRVRARERLEAAGSVLQDARFALRSLGRAPGFAVLAVLTLGLGIGATTALLGLVDQVMVRPLAYADAGELHSVWGVTESFDQIQPSYPDFVDWRAAATSVDLGYAYGEVFAVRGPDGLEQVTGSAVSPGFFDVLATPPALGRPFAADEEREGAPVVVLSWGFWQRRLGGEASAVGRDMVVDGVPHTVIGVMPAGFEYPSWSQLWVPLARVAHRVPGLEQRTARVDSRAIARVSPDAGAERAEAELRAAAVRLSELHPESNVGVSLRLAPLTEEVVGEVGSSLALMLVAGALVLLLTCANVAGILLGRALERSRELAVRRALGADRRRLVRQLVTENLVLASLGGAVGSALAFVGVRLMGRSAVAEGAITALQLPRLNELGVDGRLLFIAFVVTGVAALVLGIAPALSATAGDPALRLREQGRGGDVGRRAVRAQGTLAVAQLAIAVALLASAALLVRTLGELRGVDTGFRPEGLLVLRVFPSDAYPTADARLALYDRLRERTAGVPGISSAGLINHMPFAGGRVPTSVSPVGEAPADTAVGALYRTVSPGFFETAGVSIVRGRAFESAEAAEEVVVLSEQLAESLWPGRDVVGRHVQLVNPTPPSPRRGETLTARVVGVARDVRESPREDPLPTLYVPHALDPWGNIQVVARAAADPGSVLGGLRAAVAEVDATIPTADIQVLSQRIRQSTSRERVLSRVMLGFAGLALLLSVVGIYAALSNLVTQRIRDLGVRLAMGARPRDVRRLVLRRAAWIILPGLLAGAVAAFVMARLIEGLLFGVAPSDPVVFLAAAGLLGVVGVVAAWVPALRAGRVDPAKLLAGE